MWSVPNLRHALPDARALARCDRGANLVEYIVVVGLIALLAIAGFHRFGGDLTQTARLEAQKVAALEATTVGGAPASNGPPSGPGAPPSEGAFCTRGGCTSPGNCFPAGTPVLAVDGARPIESIHAGDIVLTRDEASGRTSLARVARTFVTPDAPLVAVRIESDGAVRVQRATPGHPFWTRDRGWVPAADLAPGEALADAQGGAPRVTDVRPLAERDTVYNFEVESTHSYFAGELAIWVHNICDGTLNINGSALPGQFSDGNHYFVPEQEDEGQAANPTDADFGLIWAQVGSPSPPSSNPVSDGSVPSFTLNGQTYVPYEPAGPVPNDCLHTAEEINAGCQLTYAAANYSQLPHSPARPWVFGGNNGANINHAQAIAEDDPEEVDQHASPDVGQAYVIVNLENPPPPGQPNYHAEAVVAQDGPDRITLSTAADDRWSLDGGRVRRPIYRIYSIAPDSGQTFYDDMHPQIPNSHVIVVEPRPNIRPQHQGTPLPGSGTVQAPPPGQVTQGQWTPTPP